MSIGKRLRDRATLFRWFGWALGICILGIGPVKFGILSSAVTGVVMLPFSHHLALSGNQYLTFNGQLLLIYFIAVLGLNFLGRTGMLSLGQGAFVGIGAYTVAILTGREHLDFYLAALIAMAVCAAVGLLLGATALRLASFAFALVTLGLGTVVDDQLNNQTGLTGGGNGLSGIKFPALFNNSSRFYWLIAVVFLVGYVVSRNTLKGPFGRQAAAVAAGEQIAGTLGVNPRAVKLKAVVLSSIFAGASGALYAPLLSYISPDAFTVQLSILLLTMVVIGGVGSVVGPLIGGLILFQVPLQIQQLTSNNAEVSQLVYGLLLVVSIYAIPRGIVGLWYAAAKRYRARPAARAPKGATAVRAVVSGAAVVVDPSHALATADADVVALQLSDIRIRLGGVMALAGCSLSARVGQVRGIIGPNGSGKTTLLNVVSGVRRQDSGQITVLGVSGGPSHARARRGVARTFQTPSLVPTLSCLENVMMGAGQADPVRLSAQIFRLPKMRRAERLAFEDANRNLAALGLAHRVAEDPRSLPAGEQRMIELARAITSRPRLLLLDEPAASLNEVERERLAQAIEAFKSDDLAIVLVEHHMELIRRLSDAVTVMDAGAVLAEGSAEEVLDDPRVIEAYIGGGQDGRQPYPPPSEEVLKVPADDE
jgi:branched-chain amino acid transport system permease protein